MSITSTKLAKRCILLAKKEATYGTDPTTSKTTDAMAAYDISISPSIETENRPEIVSSFGSFGVVVGQQTMDFSFKTITVGGIVGTGKEPPESPLLQMCGLAETACGASTAAIYKFSSALANPCTIDFYMDGTLHKLVGCRGNLVITGQAGKKLVYAFTGKGLYASGVGSAFITDPTLTKLTVAQPIVCRSMTATIGTAQEKIETFEIDCGNEITVSADVSAATGVKEINLVNRKPVLKINPEVTVTTEQTYESAATTPTALACTLNADTGTYGIQIAIPEAYIADIKTGERGGKQTLDLTLMLAQVGTGTTVDDEITITYAKA